jgi:ribosomal protein L19E
MAVAAAGEVKSAKTTRLLSGQEWLESLRKRRIVTRNLRQPHDRPGQMPEPS